MFLPLLLLIVLPWLVTSKVLQSRAVESQISTSDVLEHIHALTPIEWNPIVNADGTESRWAEINATIWDAAEASLQPSFPQFVPVSSMALTSEVGFWYTLRCFDWGSSTVFPVLAKYVPGILDVLRVHAKAGNTYTYETPIEKNVAGDDMKIVFKMKLLWWDEEVLAVTKNVLTKTTDGSMCNFWKGRAKGSAVSAAWDNKPNVEVCRWTIDPTTLNCNC